MEILDEKSKFKMDFPDLSSSEKHLEKGLIGLLMGLFVLSKEERFRAGIFVGSEGREWIDQSALIFPHDDESIENLQKLE